MSATCIMGEYWLLWIIATMMLKWHNDQLFVVLVWATQLTCLYRIIICCSILDTDLTAGLGHILLSNIREYAFTSYKITVWGICTKLMIHSTQYEIRLMLPMHNYFAEPTITIIARSLACFSWLGRRGCERQPASQVRHDTFLYMELTFW